MGPRFFLFICASVDRIYACILCYYINPHLVLSLGLFLYLIVHKVPEMVPDPLNYKVQMIVDPGLLQPGGLLCFSSVVCCFIDVQ